MKKMLKRILACLSSVAVVATASVIPASAIYSQTTLPTIENDFVEMDDKGLFKELCANNLRGSYYTLLYNKVYDYVTLAKPENNKFMFVLSDGVASDEVHEKVLEVITKYYPENNLDDTYEEIIQPDYRPEVYIKFDSYFDAATYTRYNNTYTVSFSSTLYPSQEVIEDAKVRSKAIRDELNAEGLISAFYDVGEHFNLLEFAQKDIYYESDKDINAIDRYLAENDVNCTLEYTELPFYNGIYGYKLVPDTELNHSEYTQVAIGIYEETGILFHYWAIYENNTNYVGTNSLESDTNTSPSTTLGTVTIAGDLDLNEAVGTTDIVMLSKYVASAQIYPIEDATALANADVNQDGSINSDDTAVMIEMYLGAYEMI